MGLNSIFEALSDVAGRKRENQPGYQLPENVRFNILSIIFLIIPAGGGIFLSMHVNNPIIAALGIAIGVILMQSPKVAKQWERAVVLRLGKYVGLRGAGIFWIIPFIDSVSNWIDQRVMTTSFAAEQTLTMDTVPVNVDAVLFWMVHDPEKAALTVTLTRVMYPFILLVSLAALVMGMLNARNVFGIPAMASSFFNLGSIAGGVVLGYWLDPHFGQQAILGLAIGTLIGGALQLLVQLPALRREGYAFHADFRWRDPGVRAILRLMGPSVIAASTTQVNVLVNSVFASQLGDGPTFWLTVAFRLMQLPLGVVGVALGTVALPLLARMAATGNTQAFRSELARGMRLTFLMTIPASAGLIVLAEPIISVLYQHGRFGAHETAESAGALRFYALGLCGYAALKVLVNAFYAIDRRKTPMVVSLVAVALNLLLNWIFTLRLGWGHRGLAFSTACVATSNFLILYWLMRSHLGRLESRAMLALLSKVTIASAVLLAIAWTGAHFLLADWAVQSFWPKCISLVLVIATAAAAFFLCANLLGIGEVHQIVAGVRRRLRRNA